MRETNVAAALQFIAAVTGAIADDSPLGNLCVQTFADDRGKAPQLAKQFFCPTLKSFKQLIPELIELNNQGAGVFVAINETDGKGRSVEHITSIRAVAVDLDGAPLKNIQAINLPPHVLVESSNNKYHAYWLVEDLPLSLFMPVQQHFAKLTGGDPSICDLARVLRVPGFYHLKDGNKPFLTKLLKPVIGATPERSIKLADLLLAANISVPQLTGASISTIVQDELPTLSDGEARATCTRLTKRRAELTHVPENLDKSRNQNAVYLGFELRAAGIPEELATTLGTELYLNLARGTNSAGQPEPLTDGEIKRAIGNAYLPNKVQLAPRPAKWSSPSELVAKLNERFFIIEQPFGIFQETKDGTLVSYRLSDFGALLRPEQVYDERTQKVRQADQVWLASKDRRTYSKIVMIPPPLVAPSRSYNLWQGFAVDPKAGECTRFINHLKEVICDGDEAKFQFFWNWWAQAIQEPGKKPGTTIVLRGLPGCGKGAALDTLGKLFGRHYLHLTHHDSLTKNFNAQLQNKLLIFADEMIWGGNRKDSGTLKGLITEDTLSIEPKYRDAYNVDNHIRLVIASNETWAVPVGLQDRRFFVMDVRDTYRGNTPYFNALFTELENGGRAALLQALLTTPLASAVDLRKPPITAAKEELALNSMRGVEAFIADMFASRSLLLDSSLTEYSDERKLKGEWAKEETLVSGQHQYEAYLLWCTKRHESPVNSRAFQMRLKHLFPSLGVGYIQWQGGDGKHKSVKAILFPPLKNSAEHFSKATGLSIEAILGPDLEEEGRKVAPDFIKAEDGMTPM